MTNNFDLLRLIAAVEVVYFHSVSHLRVHMGALQVPLEHVLGPLDGVPIFFVISGFLISAAYERQRDPKTYFRNRILRIYPALWVCFGLTLVMLCASGFLSKAVHTATFPPWVVGQLTLAQFVNLPVFRGYGVGVPNGSLWTISVELAFYLALPVIYLLIIDRLSKRVSNLILGSFALSSFVVTVVIHQTDPAQKQLATKLALQTLFPYLYLFLAGVVTQINFESLSRWVTGKWLWWTIAYYVVATISLDQPKTPMGDVLFLLDRVILVGWILSVAFSARNLSAKVLRGNDASYGTYLFHMLIVNVLVAAGLLHHRWLIALVVTSALTCGLLSWRIVEQPALKLKKRGDALRALAGQAH